MDKKRDQMDKIPAWRDLPPAGEGPLYERLAEQIRAAIREGRFREAQRLPSKRSLAESLGVSLTTINTAYDILCAEGYLISYPRSCYRIGPIADLYLHLPQPDKKNDAENAETPREKTAPEKQVPVRFDFDSKGVDDSLFPEKMVKRIYKRIIDEGVLSAEPEAKGLMSLRRTLADYLFSAQGLSVNPENIIISYGTMGLFRFLFDLLPKQTVYGIEDPGFPALHLGLRRSGKNFCTLELSPEGIRPELLQQKKVDAACLTPGHQFPLGIEYSASCKHALIKWAYEKDGRYLIEDDYDGMIRHRAAGESLRRLDPAGDKVIYIGSFSRSWSPGLRISYVCLPDPLRDKACRIGMPQSNPVPLTEQSFLAELIRSNVFERHLNRARRLYRRKRKRLIEAIEKSSLPWTLFAGPAGLHMTAAIPEGAMTAEDFVNAAAGCGIHIQCMQEYCFNCRRPYDLIIGFGRLPEEDIPEAVKALEDCWTQTKNTRD